MQYTIVIPAHNESSTLPVNIPRFIESLPPRVAKILGEIIIVENGSTDETLRVCRNLEDRFPGLVRVLTHSRGSYGEAIKLGMLQSRGTHLSILECDFLDIEFVQRSIDLFQIGLSHTIAVRPFTIWIEPAPVI